MTVPVLSSLVLGLAWFAALNAAASLAASVIAHRVLASNAARRATALLALRLFPSAVALVYVAALFLPAHWRFEPADAEETFGVVLYALAAVGMALVLRSAWRVAAVARAGWRLRACRHLPRFGPAPAAYEVPGLSGVSLAGVFRTRILVGSPVRRALTSAELNVAVAHELAHRGALDNLKRFAMLCAPDLFGGSDASRRVEAEWRASAECLADSRAVAGDDTRAVNLASALLKVSRLTSAPSSFGTSPAWSTLHDPPLLEMRVRRLVGGAMPAAPAGPRRASRLAGLAILAVMLLAGGGAIAPSLHRLTEALVRILP